MGLHILQRLQAQGLLGDGAFQRAAFFLFSIEPVFRLLHTEPIAADHVRGRLYTLLKLRAFALQLRRVFA